MFKVGDQVRINEKGLYVDGWDRMLNTNSVPHDHIFTIQRDTRLDLASAHGGMAYIECPEIGATRNWAIWAKHLELAHVAIDLDDDDGDCI